MQENINQQEEIKPVEIIGRQEDIASEESLECITQETKQEINTEADNAISNNQELSNLYEDNPEIQQITENTKDEIGIASDIANSQIEYIKKEEKKEASFEIQENETREAYINRIAVLLKGMNVKHGSGELVFDLTPQFSEWKHLSDEQLKEVFKNLLLIPENSKFNRQNNEEELKKIFFGIINSRANNEKSNFDETGRERPFYEDEVGSATKLIDKRAHYCVSMLGVPNIKVNEQKEYVQSIVNDKDIYLLGGGYSCQDLLDSQDFKPRSITNIDPFIDESKIAEITKESKIKYNCLKTDASSNNLLEQLKDRNIDSPDEIWASFSVPMYLDNIEQINSLFSNICNSLKEGGKCRIYPMQISDKTFDNDVDLNSKIKNIFRQMIDTEKFNISVSSGVNGYKTLTIEKVKINTQQEK